MKNNVNIKEVLEKIAVEQPLYGPLMHTILEIF